MRRPLEHPTLDQVLKLIAHLRKTEGGEWVIRCYEFGPYGPPYTVELVEALWGERPNPKK